MSQIKQYHFHEGDDNRPHFEVFDASPYVAKYGIKALTAHRHSFYQLIWFHESGSHYIDYNTFSHPEDSLFFIDKGQVHYFCDISSNQGCLFHFNDAFLNRFEFDHQNWMIYKIFNELNQPFIQLDQPSKQRVVSIYQMIMEELDQKELNYHEQLYFLFRLLLNTAERLKLKEHEGQIEASPELDTAIRFKQLVERQLHNPQDVAAYATELNLSVKQLSAITKKVFDVSPGQLINQKRAIEAKRLLSNTNQSIKEVGFQLGFNQSTYFTKFFKQHTGMTPKEFRVKNF